MLTYLQVEQALLNLDYAVDFNLRYNTKLMAFIPVDGYKSDVVFEFRESYQSELGDCEELLQVEWLMEDDESILILDKNSLDDVDEMPSLFASEKIILRKTFDLILNEIAQTSQNEYDDET